MTSVTIPMFYTPVQANDIETELQTDVGRPPAFQGDKLPFSEIGAARFEILAYLLVLSENRRLTHSGGQPRKHITLVKASGDKGRDVLEHQSGSLSKIIQCKNQQAKFGKPELIREIVKLALHSRKDAFISADKGVDYEIWVPGGLTEPAETLIGTWPNEWKPDSIREAFKSVTGTYDLLKEMTWETYGDYLVKEFSSLIRPARVEGIELANRLRVESRVFDQFFRANLVAELSQVQHVVASSLQSARSAPNQGDFELAVDLGLGLIDERQYTGESVPWQKASLMYRISVHLTTPNYAEDVVTGLVFYSGDRLYTDESRLPLWLGQSIELGDKGPFHRMLHRRFELGSVGPSAVGVTSWADIHVSINHAPWRAAAYVVAKGLKPQFFQLELPVNGHPLVPMGGSGVQVWDLRLVTVARPVVDIGACALLSLT